MALRLTSSRFPGRTHQSGSLFDVRVGGGHSRLDMPSHRTRPTLLWVSLPRRVNVVQNPQLPTPCRFCDDLLAPAIVRTPQPRLAQGLRTGTPKELSVIEISSSGLGLLAQVRCRDRRRSSVF
jgi:hypothetical protein